VEGTPSLLLFILHFFFTLNFIIIYYNILLLFLKKNCLFKESFKMDFTSAGFKRNRNGSGPERSPPIPITRTHTGPMNIPGSNNDRNNHSNALKRVNYSQSCPAPRAPIIGSMPAPAFDKFEQMPTLELPPSFKDDEIARSFGAPGTSLGSSHRGYPASCPAPSFMSQALQANRRRRGNGNGISGGSGGGGSGGSREDTSTSRGGGNDFDHARTPSYNTPSMGSRTVLSVLLETDETEYQDDKNIDGSGGSKGMMTNISGQQQQQSGIKYNANMSMAINLEKLDLKAEVDDDVVPEDNFSDYDEGGMFQMDTDD
jgi:hypothetical protein